MKKQIVLPMLSLIVVMVAARAFSADGKGIPYDPVTDQTLEGALRDLDAIVTTAQVNLAKTTADAEASRAEIKKALEQMRSGVAFGYAEFAQIVGGTFQTCTAGEASFQDYSAAAVRKARSAAESTCKIQFGKDCQLYEQLVFEKLDHGKGCRVTAIAAPKP